MTTRNRLRLAQATRLVSLLATSYFLVATSQPATPPSSGIQGCTHGAQSVRFEVTSSCGPTGVITVSSPQDECFITVEGAAAVGLPAAGRFDTAAGTQSVDLKKDPWTLSDYPPDPPTTEIPVPPATPDASPMRDAGAPPPDARPDSTFVVATGGSTGSTFGVVDAYVAPTTPAFTATHPAPWLRECRVDAWYQNKPRISCTGARLCTGTLTRL